MNPITFAAVLLATLLPLFLAGRRWELSWVSLIMRGFIFIPINLVSVALLGTGPLLSLVASLVLLGIEIPCSILPFFYSDPERSIPDDDNSFFSPADGHIVYIKRLDRGRIPLCTKKGRTFSPTELSGIDNLAENGYLIGIGMNFLDVHVTRIPKSGDVVKVTHVPGKFISLKRPEAVVQNERASVAVRTPEFTYGVVLIASRLVRRIEIWVKQKESVRTGRRLGIIKFGSQVDVILPGTMVESILVKPGDKVTAGITPIASLQRSE